MDIDAAGGVATAGLIGAAIEKPTGQAGEHTGVCTDCGQATTGKFCSNCGQPTHVHRSLLHLGEEMLHGVLHFDARIWRTLPLLAINPGRLTREWVQGKRTRYVSPLAIFLFTVFIMFFAFSFMGFKGDVAAVDLDRRVVRTEAELAEARTSLAETSARLAPPAGAPGKTDADAAEAVAVSGLEQELTRLRAAKAQGQTTITAGDGWTATLAERARSGEFKVNTGSKRLDKILMKKALNPDLAIYKIQQTAYKFSFLLIPISLPFVALLFLWRRGFTLYDHGVFVLYSLTAMSILFLSAALLMPVWPGFAWLFAGLMTFGIPVHMFAQLKGAYGLNWFSAMWRTVLLLVFASIALTLFLLAIITLGLTG